jgi:hypothetical protein
MTISQRRLLQLFAILVTWALIVLARLAQVQLLHHDAYVAKAQRQQERTLSLDPVRGSILDARAAYSRKAWPRSPSMRIRRRLSMHAPLPARWRAFRVWI